MKQVAGVFNGKTLKTLHVLSLERIHVRSPNDTQKNGATSSIATMGRRTF